MHRYHCVVCRCRDLGHVRHHDDCEIVGVDDHDLPCRYYAGDPDVRVAVTGLDVDARRERVVALANDVAHVLGAIVVAEGVETAAEAAALRDAGIDALQGFGLCRPLGPDAMTEFLLDRAADVA